MSESRQYYRKNLTSHGFIYLAGEELKIEVKNFSITGLLVELLPNPFINDITDFYRAIESNNLVDIYLEEMRLAGEVSVVRADMVDEGLQVAMEFVHISYDVDAIFYKRKAYRKSLVEPGEIFLNGSLHPFKTVNASVNGLMIYFEGKITATSGLITTIEIESAQLSGETEIVWVEDDPEGGTLMGLNYIHMQKDSGSSVTP
ncbi:MAG: PilZ domain-containing protein [Methylococcaceae bacterium]|nr:PilZ domain-containing protein [Methylococcaceae bacterium]